MAQRFKKGDKVWEIAVWSWQEQLVVAIRESVVLACGAKVLRLEKNGVPRGVEFRASRGNQAVWGHGMATVMEGDKEDIIVEAAAWGEVYRARRMAGIEQAIARGIGGDAYLKAMENDLVIWKRPVKVIEEPQ